MAFSTRRGRPPRARLDDTDSGTPELQFKRALGVTREPIDLCLDRQLISPDQHWCGLHLRWLYTLRYGAPILTTRYADKDTQCLVDENNNEWRALREKEYHSAVLELQRAGSYEPIMRLCVFNETPAFLSVALIHRGWAEPALADALNRCHRNVLQGLDILTAQWRPAARITHNHMASHKKIAKMSP